MIEALLGWAVLLGGPVVLWYSWRTRYDRYIFNRPRRGFRYGGKK